MAALVQQVSNAQSRLCALYTPRDITTTVEHYATGIWSVESPLRGDWPVYQIIDGYCVYACQTEAGCVVGTYNFATKIKQETVVQLKSNIEHITMADPDHIYYATDNTVGVITAGQATTLHTGNTHILRYFQGYLFVTACLEDKEVLYRCDARMMNGERITESDSIYNIQASATELYITTKYSWLQYSVTEGLREIMTTQDAYIGMNNVAYRPHFKVHVCNTLPPHDQYADVWERLIRVFNKDDESRYTIIKTNVRMGITCDENGLLYVPYNNTFTILDLPERTQ